MGVVVLLMVDRGGAVEVDWWVVIGKFWVWVVPCC